MQWTRNLFVYSFTHLRTEHDAHKTLRENPEKGAVWCYSSFRNEGIVLLIYNGLIIKQGKRYVTFRH